MFQLHYTGFLSSVDWKNKTVSPLESILNTCTQEIFFLNPSRYLYSIIIDFTTGSGILIAHDILFFDLIGLVDSTICYFPCISRLRLSLSLRALLNPELFSGWLVSLLEKFHWLTQSTLAFHSFSS